MTVIIHPASTDKRVLDRAAFRPCPFCSCETLHVCATPGNIAIACDCNECHANVYFNTDAESGIAKWNTRDVSG